MNKSDLFKEALADAKKLREVATHDATNAVIEALTPRIKQFVEEQLLETSVEGPPRVFGDETTIEDDECCIDDISANEIEEPNSITATFEFEPFDELSKNVNQYNNVQFESLLKKISTIIEKRFTKNIALVETKSFNSKFIKILTELENMYEYVQEVVSDPARKSKLSESLEKHYKDLKQFQEDTMKTRKNKIFEADDMNFDVADDSQQTADTSSGSTKKVSLNINVPEDIADKIVDSLSDIEISLDDETGESGEEELEVSDEDTSDEDLDIDLDVDASDEEAENSETELESDTDEEDEELQLSSKQLDDETVVEIDENMLRNELRRMRSIKENGVPTPTTDGVGVSDAALAAFGGGVDAGDPFVDGEVETAETQVAESLKKESRIQQIAKLRGNRLKTEGTAALARNDRVTYNKLKTQYLAEAKKYTDSVKRTQRLQESANKNRSRNSNSSVVVENTLNKKLAESNLNNAKLMYANKVLQQTNISNDMKLKIVDQLDEIKSPREAKIVFENAIKLISNKKENDHQPVVGSAGRATRSGSSSVKLNEGYEVARWGRLAGIDK